MSQLICLALPPALPLLPTLRLIAIDDIYGPPGMNADPLPPLYEASGSIHKFQGPIGQVTTFSCTGFPSLHLPAACWPQQGGEVSCC